MPNYKFIGKSQLSRGFSFPLKRSRLDAFLDERRIETVTGVAYCGPSQEQRVFEADYYGPARRAMNHTLTVWINAVPSSLRQYIAAEIEGKWLAELANWIAQFVDGSKLVSQTDHRFEVRYEDAQDDGTCQLKLRLDAPRQYRHGPRFRMKVRP